MVALSSLRARRIVLPALLALLASAPILGADPQCADGDDDDGDLLVDFPADPGCHSANDDEETDPPGGAAFEARLLLAVAASGTLNGDLCAGAFTGGDGSVECPGSDVACATCPATGCGNGMADDSRIHHLRIAVAELANRRDVELALVRSAQNGVAFACPSASALSAAGGWLGAAAACSTGLDGGGAVVRFSAGNGDDLAGWLDGDDDWLEAGTPDAGHDFELRATGDRPLGGLLDAAALEVAEARADDVASACRPYRVVLVADGGESCGGDAEAAADALFDAGVPVHVIALAVTDEDDETELGAVAAAGGTVLPIHVDSSSDLATALDAIAEESAPIETCNGLDDDCDTLVDEEFPFLGEACDDGGIGECRGAGSWTCDGSGKGVVCALDQAPSPPEPESCNGLDDDCDGVADEGGVCVPGGALCDGVDDLEDGFPIGASCTSGTGACRVAGFFACRPDQLGVRCAPETTPPPPADLDLACDGVDEDCDGEVDEEAVDEMVQVAGGFWIDRYEASRPDAGPFSAGARSDRACSRPDVLPWSYADHATAAAACVAAGKRLCTEAEWQAACGGPALRVYPYGNVYDPEACNGADLDPDCTGPDDDHATATATAHGCPAPVDSACVAPTGALDLSGNLAEWTSTPVDATRKRVRGGAFDSGAPALACTHAQVAREATGFRPNLGFRCCADEPPLSPLVFEDGFEAGHLDAWSSHRS